MDVILFAARAVIGFLFIGHGTQKLFGWFGGGGPEGTAGMFKKLGYHPPQLAVTAAGASEAGGGVLLILGFLTPVAAAAVIGVMVNAIGSVHGKNGPWVTKGGYEYPLVVILTAAVITAVGPGLASVDAGYGLATWGGFWAFGALVVGVATGLAVNASRRPEAADSARTGVDTPAGADSTRRAA